jgi:HK97 family phage prohead protease
MNEMPELEHRSSRIAEISFPKRTIELIVMPYETAATVGYHGRMIEEIVTRGAYDGVEKRTSQISVNRGHDIEKPVGRTVALHPSRTEGLVAEVKISKTDLGEETLVLADDGILSASAGFRLLLDNTTGRVKRNAEVWETRSRRRLNYLHLDHIAMTPVPAYESARVLAVRNVDRDPVPAGTPNLDELRLLELERMASDLDARYGLSR